MAAVFKIGIVGAGGIVRDRHLPNLREIDGVEIVAVANSSLTRSASFCAAHAPEAEPMGDWRELIARPDLDIVWIGATPFLHRSVTIAALEAGKHVFCQARMAPNLAEAREMLAVSEKFPNQVTMLCPPPYGLRNDVFIRQVLESGRIGEVRSLELRSRNASTLDATLPPHWRQRREISGYNVMTLGIYTEVLQRWFGDVAAVSGTARIFTPKRGDYPIEIPEQLDVLAEFGSGVTGVLRFSSIHTGESEETLEIVGSRSTLRVNFAKDEITLAGEAVPNPPELDRPWRVERDFIDAVQNLTAPRPRPTFADGVAYMAVVEAVHFAWHDQRRVALPIPNGLG